VVRKGGREGGKEGGRGGRKGGREGGKEEGTVTQISITTMTGFASLLRAYQPALLDRLSLSFGEEEGGGGGGGGGGGAAAALSSSSLLPRFRLEFRYVTLPPSLSPSLPASPIRSS